MEDKCKASESFFNFFVSGKAKPKKSCPEDDEFEIVNFERNRGSISSSSSTPLWSHRSCAGPVRNTNENADIVSRNENGDIIVKVIPTGTDSEDSPDASEFALWDYTNRIAQTNNVDVTTRAAKRCEFLRQQLNPNPDWRNKTLQVLDPKMEDDEEPKLETTLKRLDLNKTNKNGVIS